MNPIPVLMVTHNRLEYSKQALESICADPGLPLEIVIWDNGSDAPTVEWLLSIADRQFPNTVSLRVLLNGENVGLAPAMNHFFKKYADAPYVVKVDNDTVLPAKWLADLMDVMEYFEVADQPILKRGHVGAVSGTCLRPPGLTASEWYSRMSKYGFKHDDIYFNPACLGTGVLINMDMIRERGLLFERFPRSPEDTDHPCLISGWGAYIQEASAYSDWRFAMYSKVPVRLLNLKEDQVLSNDYPEYDAMVRKIRDDGNAWWESVGGIEGVRRYVQENGGLDSLPGHPRKIEESRPLAGAFYQTLSPAMKEWLNSKVRSTVSGLETLKRAQEFYAQPRTMFLPLKARVRPDSCADPQDMALHRLPLLTEADNLEYRSTPEFWTKRIADHGARASTFLATPQARINEFTEQHMQILKRYIPGKDILDVGAGWGRLALPISQMAKSYIGTDFMPELIEKAKESMPDLDFRVADAKKLPFADEHFDIVVAVTCLSSFAGVFDQVLPELKRVLRKDGFILFLEENFARIDWKLANA